MSACLPKAMYVHLRRAAHKIQAYWNWLDLTQVGRFENISAPWAPPARQDRCTDIAWASRPDTRSSPLSWERLRRREFSRLAAITKRTQEVLTFQHFGFGLTL